MRSSAPLSVFAALLLALAPFAAVPALAASPAPGASAAAADPITWSVKPSDDSKGARAAFGYATDPGTQVNDTVVVINSGKVSADFAVYAADAINDRETGDLSLVARATKSSDLGAWITLDVATLHLEPGTQATIPFTMLVPSDASPGDHSAGIVASSTTTGTSKGQTVLVDQRVGARINLRVSGAVSPRVTATGFVTSFTPSLNPFAPGTVDVDYSVANRGNIRLDIGQKLNVVGPFGIPLGEVSPPTVHNLLPGQSAHIVSRMSGVGALLLAWSTVTLSPGPAGIVPAKTTSPSTTATDETIDPNADVKFTTVSATTLSVAVTWTLLAIVVLLGVLVFLAARYVRTTRAQFYAAVDQAAAEARESAAQAAELTETVPTR
ncbi:hypothetical protein F1C58_12625 [Glaciihabitans sp. INWT7]|uniref:hypothetical protein n=1 Tax=Glaciihabitans sp. INWT7 TaxID=2596912 RepID=UPI001629742B|nr:hypothetical protein [Glaciihabitans sp. INWT7]QNE47660.1 hypothetical protein F1C58_12625 [Glaciihabitans sp. INWT7]